VAVEHARPDISQVEIEAVCPGGCVVVGAESQFDRETVIARGRTGVCDYERHIEGLSETDGIRPVTAIDMKVVAKRAFHHVQLGLAWIIHQRTGTDP